MIDSEETKKRSDAPVKIKKKMGLGLIIASLFFLFNPDISVIDLIPDTVGYILLTLGLSHLSLMSEYLSDAGERFKKMILVSACKFASIIFIFGMSDAANRPYSYLLFSFVFCVIDLMLLLPAYKDLFSGILDLANRCGSELAFSKKRPYGRNYTERIGALTVAFAVLKSVCATAPEFLSLLTTEYTDSFTMYLYDYISAFRLMSAFVATVIGVIWLVKSVTFFAGLGKEKVFMDNVMRSFNENIIPKKNVFIKRSLNTVLMMLTVAAVFCVDFAMGSVGIVGDSAAEINILPDAVAALLIFMSAHAVRNYIGNTKRLKIAAISYFILSVVASALKLAFIVKFDYYTAINKIDEATSMFTAMCIATVLENIAFLVTVVFLIGMLREMIKSYTGYAAYAGAENSERVTTLQKELTGKLKYMLIFGIVGAISAVVYEFFLPEKFVLAQYMWLVDLVCQSLFAGFTLRCIFAIKDEVDNRFMLE